MHVFVCVCVVHCTYSVSALHSHYMRWVFDALRNMLDGVLGLIVGEADNIRRLRRVVVWEFRVVDHKLIVYEEISNYILC